VEVAATSEVFLVKCGGISLRNSSTDQYIIGMIADERIL
jgi:hypothetical protein